MCSDKVGLEQLSSFHSAYFVGWMLLNNRKEGVVFEFFFDEPANS
jgi:hypothetical protein